MLSSQESGDLGNLQFRAESGTVTVSKIASANQYLMKLMNARSHAAVPVYQLSLQGAMQACQMMRILITPNESQFCVPHRYVVS